MNELMKLLDNGWGVTFFKNEMGSYTAIAHRSARELFDPQEARMTDDFTPDETAKRLVEKIFGNIIEPTDSEGSA